MINCFGKRLEIFICPIGWVSSDAGRRVYDTCERDGSRWESFQVRRVVRTNSSWRRGPGRGVPAVASTHWSTAGARRHLPTAAWGSCSRATCRCYTSRSDTSSWSSRCGVCSTRCKYSARLKPKKNKESYVYWNNFSRLTRKQNEL